MSVILGAALAPALVMLTAPDDIAEHLIAGAAAGTFFLLAVLAYPRGMGMGPNTMIPGMGFGPFR